MSDDGSNDSIAVSDLNPVPQRQKLEEEANDSPLMMPTQTGSSVAAGAANETTQKEETDYDGIIACLSNKMEVQDELLKGLADFWTLQPN